MRIIFLTQGKFALVDDEDYEHLNQFKWCLDHKGYAKRTKYGIYMHRVIMNTPKGYETDHINHNILDNRKENLRICKKADNLKNSKIYKNNKSGHKGVFYCKNKSVNPFAVHIQSNKKNHHVGYYATLEEAVKAYNKAAIKYHKEFALLNQL